MLLLLLIGVIRLTMQKRKNPCLDAFLNEVQITIWPRLKILFDQHIQSIRKASPQELIESVNEQQRTHPHYITRRSMSHNDQNITKNINSLLIF